MTYEFEGKTEQEAVDNAVEALKIDREFFDIEIIENGRKGLFRKNVKIRVHVNEPAAEPADENMEESVNPELEDKLITFVTTLIEKMGYPGTVSVACRKERKICLQIDSEFSAIIIGRKGKNLDAIQLLANVYIGQFDPDLKVVVDSENYRMKHEETIIRNAYKTAEYVAKSGKSRLLEPMNPFERRLVHTALSDFANVETKSEGEGLYKQIRIIPVKTK